LGQITKKHSKCYDQHTWDDTNIRPDAFQKYWDDLTKEEKNAAKEIGYTREEWDD
jgi:hypothetical protein